MMNIKTFNIAKNISSQFFLVLLIFFSSAFFYNTPVKAKNTNDIEVSGYIVNAPKSIKIFASYLTLTNRANQDIKLISGSSDSFDKVEFHISEIKNSMMRMRELSNIKIKAGETFNMMPGSYHLMLINNLIPINLGEIIKVNLIFDDKSSKEVELEVKARKTMIHK